MPYCTLCCRSSVFSKCFEYGTETNIFSLSGIYRYPFIIRAATGTNYPLILNIVNCSYFPSKLAPSTTPNPFYIFLIAQKDLSSPQQRECVGNTNQASGTNIYRASRGGCAARGMMHRSGRACKASVSTSITVSNNEESLSNSSKFQSNETQTFFPRTIPRSLQFSTKRRSRNYLERFLAL